MCIVRRPTSLVVGMLLLTGCFGSASAPVSVEEVTVATVTQVVAAPATVEAAAARQVVAGASGVVVSLDAATGETVQAGQTVVQLASEEVARALEQARSAQQAAVPGEVVVPRPGSGAVLAAGQVVAELDDDALPRLAAARVQLEQVDDPEQREAIAATINAVERAYRDVREALLTAGTAAAAQQDAIAESVAVALNSALSEAGAAQQVQTDAAAAAAQSQAEGLVARSPGTGVIELAAGEAGGAIGGGLPELPTDVAGLASGLVPPTAGGADVGPLAVGARVSAGQPLFTVYDQSDWYVTAMVDEIDAPEVTVGQRTSVRIDALDAELEGAVESVGLSPASSAAGGVAYPVRVRLADADPAPKVGMTAGVEITTRTVPDALTVPSRAIVRGEDGEVVYVVRKGRALTVGVEVLALGDARAAVTAGLAEGDRVVVSGYDQITDGASVQIVDEQPIAP